MQKTDSTPAMIGLARLHAVACSHRIPERAATALRALAQVDDETAAKFAEGRIRFDADPAGVLLTIIGDDHRHSVWLRDPHG